MSDKETKTRKIATIAVLAAIALYVFVALQSCDTVITIDVKIREKIEKIEESANG